MKLGVIMDPIEGINTKKDSTFAMMLEAQKRGYELHYMTHNQLFIMNHKAMALSKTINLFDDNNKWFEYNTSQQIELKDLDVILMRKDPPFDMEYVMDTYILDIAKTAGVLVINDPQALRDANEKFFTESFPTVTPNCVISKNQKILRDFALTQSEIIIKPMDGMGGTSIFKTSKNDSNLNVIIETVTEMGTRTTMAQEFLPGISQGDKRILLINGKPIPFALARIPSEQDFRGNLAKGGTGKGQPLSVSDYHICNVVGPKLKEMGIVFAGIDVIGDKLTEVNVTSPTCIRELDHLFNLNIASDLFDEIELILSEK
jgi:glutathione synthase